MAYKIKLNSRNTSFKLIQISRKFVLNQVGRRGLPGDKGDQGDAGTIQVGTVTTVPYTDPATIINVGTDEAAIFDFEIPQGEPGEGGGAVNSVFNRSGDVHAQADDYSAAQVSFDDAHVSSISGGYLQADYVQGMIDKFGDGFVNLSNQIVAIGAGGFVLTRLVPKTAHGLSVGNWVRETGGSDSGTGIYVLALADTLDHAQAVWLVNEVPDANNFRIILAGYATNMTGLTLSTMYYLSPTIPGTITTTKPNTPGQVIKPVMFTVGSTRGYINGGFAAEVVGENLKSANNLSDVANVTTAKTNLSLQNVDNTSDEDKPVSTDTQAALNLKQDLSEKDSINGYPGLDASGKINPLQLPATAITETSVVNSQAAMLALVAQTGDVAVRTDLSKSFILTADPATTLANWQELLSPTDQVTSVFGRQAVVTAQNGDYTASQITNVPAGNIASSDVQTALNELDSEKVPTTRTVNTKALSSNITLNQDEILDGTTYKQYSATEKTKLSGIAANATANQTDAYLLARANHTGTQLAATISDFATAVGLRITAAIGSTLQAWSANLDAWALKVAPSGTVLGTTDTQTVSNKRITNRVVTVTQSATPAINTDTTDVASITGLAQAITSMTSGLTGTPVSGDTLVIKITDNGTARAITWGSSFEASTMALPTTTTISTMLTVGFMWNSATSKWRCVAVA